MVFTCLCCNCWLSWSYYNGLVEIETWWPGVGSTSKVSRSNILIYILVVSLNDSDVWSRPPPPLERVNPCPAVQRQFVFFIHLIANTISSFLWKIVSSHNVIWITEHCNIFYQYQLHFTSVRKIRYAYHNKNIVYNMEYFIQNHVSKN